MTQKNDNQAIAQKIRKWLKTIQEIQTSSRHWAINTTRLTSIKSLCKTANSAQSFALYLVLKIQEEMDELPCPENLESEEWQHHKALFQTGINLMQQAMNKPLQPASDLKNLLTQIDKQQGNDYRTMAWTTVHFVRSGYLLKLEYALRCWTDHDHQYWAYKLAREYAEKYSPGSGSGLNHESIPALLTIAKFWCQYYFEQTLLEKFPKVMAEINETGAT